MSDHDELRADAPKIGNATEALQRLREAGGDAWDKIDDPEEYLGRRDHPPLTRERVEKAVGELYASGAVAIGKSAVTDRLCRLLDVKE